jgi:hypothetical protein
MPEPFYLGEIRQPFKLTVSLEHNHVAEVLFCKAVSQLKIHAVSYDFISFRCLTNGLNSTDTCQQALSLATHVFHSRCG